MGRLATLGFIVEYRDNKRGYVINVIPGIPKTYIILSEEGGELIQHNTKTSRYYRENAGIQEDLAKLDLPL